jgi:hypothetical protein
VNDELERIWQEAFVVCSQELPCILPGGLGDSNQASPKYRFKALSLYQPVQFFAVITGVLCLICCTISMAFAHGAGNYVFILFDNFSGNFPLLIIAFFEVIGVSYVYGIKR